MKVTQLNSNYAQELSNLTMRSKAIWGYSSSQLLEWKDDLTLTEFYFKEFDVFGIVKHDRILGYYSFQYQQHQCYLDMVFVEPRDFKKGIGKILMEDFHARIKTTNLKSIYLYADPNAEPFYLKMGYKTTGQKPSSIKDRTLPIMTFEL